MQPKCQQAVLAGIGLFCSAMLVLYLKTSPQMSGANAVPFILSTGMMAVIVPLGLFVIRRRIHLLLLYMNVGEGTNARFLRHDIFTYGIFLAYGFAPLGLKPNLTFLLLLLALLAVMQLGLLWFSADASQKERWFGSPDALPLLFFVSGFAALIYQVLWQRVLFATFGINIESVTVIVSVFMFGLGIGALMGGLFQKLFPGKALQCFVGIELVIGLFGLISNSLIHVAGAGGPPGSLPALIVTTYALLALPTMLMGATLPLLVGYLHQRFGNLGMVLGKLYAYNTFGSALAAFFTVYLLFVVFGQQGTLVVAACCNFITAAMVYAMYRHGKGHNVPAAAVQEPQGQLAASLALFLSAIVGYVALGLEILWFRVIGMLTGSKPQMFGLLLCVFLAGIGAGSLKSKREVEAGQDMRGFIRCCLFWLFVVAYLAFPLTGMVSGLNRSLGLIAALGFVGAIAFLTGGIFPALCHAGIRQTGGKNIGGAVAWMYFANIVGATLGSLLTGLVLLDCFTLGQNMALAAVMVLLPLLVLARRQWAAFAVIAAVLCAYPLLYAGRIEQLQWPETGKAASFKYISQNRSGIITSESFPGGDIVYGNGAYDGRFNIDPVGDSNGITRAFMLASLHPKPARILEIGLSTGSWARVYTMYQPLRELISIEINPGYVEMIRHYPDIAPVLDNPKVKLKIDDGRRWLSRNPDERFDVIVMNTTWYWRSNATNLLSRNFLEMCKRHLKPGGIVYYNTTGAPDSTYTAAHVFKYVVTYSNLVAAGDSPFAMTEAQRRENLLRFTDDQGRPLWRQSEALGKVLDKLATQPLPDARDAVLKRGDLWLITDDNMASEFRIENHFLPPSLYYSLWGKD